MNDEVQKLNDVIRELKSRIKVLEESLAYRRTEYEKSEAKYEAALEIMKEIVGELK